MTVDLRVFDNFVTADLRLSGIFLWPRTIEFVVLLNFWICGIFVWLRTSGFVVLLQNYWPKHFCIYCDHRPASKNLWYFYTTADCFLAFFVNADLWDFGIYCDRRPASFWYFGVTANQRVSCSFFLPWTWEFVTFLQNCWSKHLLGFCDNRPASLCHILWLRTCEVLALLCDCAPPSFWHVCERVHSSLWYFYKTADLNIFGILLS